MRLASAIQAVACAGGIPRPDKSATVFANVFSPLHTTVRWPGLVGSNVASRGWIRASNCRLIAPGSADAWTRSVTRRASCSFAPSTVKVNQPPEALPT